MKIGIIGCGKISSAYFNGAQKAQNLSIKACADIHMPAAEAKALEFGVQAMTVDQLLADPEIELVVNLTIPRVHGVVGKQILDAGKHVYAEKPLEVSFAEGKSLLDHAAAKNLRVGSAPDTFLFGNAQTARKLVDDNWIGRVTSGSARMASGGVETWHPNPAFYYDLGGGPVFDMGPYYFTGLVNLLGPAQSLIAKCSRAWEERVATCKEKMGLRIPVKVDTHCAGVLEFANGVLIDVVMSFDTKKNPAAGSQISLQGTEGAMIVGDPNIHRDPVTVYRPSTKEFLPMPTTHPANARMIGVVDMVDAIRHNRPHRASGELALHVLEIMEAFEKSSTSGSCVTFTTTCERPAALPLGLAEWSV